LIKGSRLLGDKVRLVCARVRRGKGIREHKSWTWSRARSIFAPPSLDDSDWPAGDEQEKKKKKKRRRKKQNSKTKKQNSEEKEKKKERNLT